VSLDSLKQQIRQMQALQINGSYVLNTSQRNILDDVLKLVGDFEKTHIIKTREELEKRIEELTKKSSEHCLDNPHGYSSRMWERFDAIRQFIKDELLGDVK